MGVQQDMTLKTHSSGDQPACVEQLDEFLLCVLVLLVRENNDCAANDGNEGEGDVNEVHICFTVPNDDLETAMEGSAEGCISFVQFALVTAG
jgi:hypothetical protein